MRVLAKHLSGDSPRSKVAIAEEDAGCAGAQQLLLLVLLHLLFLLVLLILLFCPLLSHLLDNIEPLGVGTGELAVREGGGGEHKIVRAASSWRRRCERRCCCAQWVAVLGAADR